MPRRLAVLLLASMTIGAGSSRPSATLAGTRVVVLGTGNPNADPDRSGPALAIIAGDEAYLVDAGPGVVRRAALAARADAIPSLAPERIRRVFVTHLHSDHTTGLPDLILAPWVLGRMTPLEVYGPPGTRRMAELLERAYSEDVDIRLHGGEPSNKTGWAVTARDVAAGVVYRDSNVTVTAFDVAHGAWKHSLGYRFQTRDRTIVVSGDTRPTEAVVRACNGCDVLVHEVYSAERFATLTPTWQRYHSAFHTSTSELADLASRAHPRLLVLYHQLYWGDDDANLLRQIGATYQGRVVSGKDTGVY